MLLGGMYATDVHNDNGHTGQRVIGYPVITSYIQLKYRRVIDGGQGAIHIDSRIDGH